MVSALAEPGVVYPVLGFAGVIAACRDGWRHACVPCLVVAGWLFAEGWLRLTSLG